MDKVIENTNSMKQPEEWKPIPGYEGLYEISNWGRVKSYKLDSNGKILVPGMGSWGYFFVNLSKDGKVKGYTIHKLVAEAFIPNPDKLSIVNHRDENKQNNYFENLEWCTLGYNLAYGTRGQRIAEKLSKSVVQFDKNGVFITEYSSAHEASRLTSIAYSSILSCCQHKKGRNSAGGYIFMFKDEYLHTQTHQDK